MNRITRIFATIFAALVFVVPSFAQQVTSNIAQAQASISVAESLTVSLGSGSINIPPDGTPSAQVTINYSFNLIPSNHAGGLQEVSYFSSPTAALANSTGVNVPASLLSESFSSSAYQACNGTAQFGVGVAGATCPAFSLATQSQLASQNGVGTGSNWINLEYTGGQLSASGSPYLGTFSVVLVAP